MLDSSEFSFFERRWMMRFVSDFPVYSYYVPGDEEPFICSDPSSSGMTKCTDIPSLTCYKGAKNGCINWNQYYHSCSTSGENPFSGSINFDNIGHAWLTIFQVSLSLFRSAGNELVHVSALSRSSRWRDGRVSCTMCKMLTRSGPGSTLLC